MTYKNIVLVDFSVICHRIYNKYLEFAKIFGAQDQKTWGIVKHLWNIELGRGCCILYSPEQNLSEMTLESFPRFTPLFLLDKSDEEGEYWRHKLMRIDPFMKGQYKDGRPDKSKEFYRVRQLGREYVSKLNYPTLEQELFEADDLAGLVCRWYKDHIVDIYKSSIYKDNLEIILWTLDRDWSQLVSDKYNIVLSNYRKPKPLEPCQNRRVTEEEVIKHTQWKYNINIQAAYELLDIKVCCGDESDSLPPGENSRVYMDLLHPCPLFCFNLDLNFNYKHLIDKIERFFMQESKENNVELLHKSLHVLKDFSLIIFD